MRSCPSGCVCQAEREPGSKVTEPPESRDGGVDAKSISTRTRPVKFALGPACAERAARRVITIVSGCWAATDPAATSVRMARAVASKMRCMVSSLDVVAQPKPIVGALLYALEHE